MTPHLTHPDDALPGCQVLLHPKRLAGRLENWIGPCELQIKNIRYKPATSCLVSYQMRQDGHESFLHAKCYQPSDWKTRQSKASRGFLDHEFAFAAWRFPDDLELPAARLAIVSPESFLDRVMLAGQPRGEIESCRVLAYKPNRRLVLRVDRANAAPVVVKLYDETTFAGAIRSAGCLKKLAHDLLPVRVGRSNSLRALAFQWIDGQPFQFDSAGQNEPSINDIVQWLRRLQQPVNTLKFHVKVRNPEEGIDRIGEYLATICPLWSPRILETVKMLHHRFPGTFEPCLAHGDFYDHQLLITDQGLRACDFDNCCVADSTVDLANFAAHAIHDSLQQVGSSAVKELAIRFEDAFGESSSSTSEHWRFRWHLAASLFRLVTHPFREGQTDWVARTDSILDTVARQLDRMRGSRRSILPNVKPGPTASTADRLASDANFAFLVDVLDVRTANNELHQQVPELHADFGNFAVHRVLPLRHKPGRRCLIEFQLATDRGLRSVLGKCSAKRLNRDAYALQRELYANQGFGERSPDGISVARPIAKWPGRKMWFQEKLAGESASELMQASKLGQALDQIAKAIHKLHRCGLRPQRTHTLSDEMTHLENRLIFVLAERQECAGGIERLRHECRQVAALIGNDVPVPVHRDFYQDQILIAPEKTWLIDLDLVAWGHPALDIGNFCAHLVEHGLRSHTDPNHWQLEEDQLIDLYQSRNPTCSRRDILAFRVLSFARHVAISHSIPNRQSKTESILATALNLARQFLTQAPARTEVPCTAKLNPQFIL